jgi:hypothetical protein
MRNKEYFVIIVMGAILIKLLLFLLATVYVPQSKFLPDSSLYLKTADMLRMKGAFATQNTNGSLKYEINRTPGYPIFIALINGVLKIPLGGIIFIQQLLIILVAGIVYKTAEAIEPKLKFLSAIIILYSPTLNIYSLMILTETLFIFFISMFMFCYVQYLKNGEIKSLLLSSVMLVLASYVRPGCYFLGIIMTFFIIYANAPKDTKKTLQHALFFIFITYSSLGVWQLRNYQVAGVPVFSSIFFEDPIKNGLCHSFLRNTNHFKHHFRYDIGPVLYYMDATWQSFWSFMSRPGSLKYFNCHALTVIGKVFAYPFMIFWMIGFLWGIINTGRNIYYKFLLLVIVYFVSGSILSDMLIATSRFRMPIMPYIAIISAYGWIKLISIFQKDKWYIFNIIDRKLKK